MAFSVPKKKNVSIALEANASSAQFGKYWFCGYQEKRKWLRKLKSDDAFGLWENDHIAHPSEYYNFLFIDDLESIHTKVHVGDEKWKNAQSALHCVHVHLYQHSENELHSKYTNHNRTDSNASRHISDVIHSFALFIHFLEIKYCVECIPTKKRTISHHISTCLIGLDWIGWHCAFLNGIHSISLLGHFFPSRSYFHIFDFVLSLHKCYVILFMCIHGLRWM